jgi:uncharacterized protein YraI
MMRLPFSRIISARNLLFCCLLPLMLAGCNLNQSPAGEEIAAISGVPVVRITSPQPAAIFREGVNVPIQAQISNAGADIQRVDLLIDGNVGRTFEAPNSAAAPAFSVTDTWTATGPGPHTIDVIAYRADGSSSVSVQVSVTVIADTVIETEEPSPTSAGQAASTQTRATTAQAGSQPSNTPAPTTPPATATSSRPSVTTTQGLNVRSGPGTIFNPPIGSLAANTTVDLLARNTAGDWYKIRYYNGEGWVFSGLVRVNGDITNLPSEAGPPPPPPTAVPVIPTVPATTPIPATSVNLVAGNWRFDPPGDPTCGQTFNIFFDVANLGSTATTTGGSVLVLDSWNGAEQARTTGGFGVIQAGQTVNVGPIPLTISTNYGQVHTLRLTINPDNSIPETGTGDNVREITFTLQRGSCP